MLDSAGVSNACFKGACTAAEGRNPTLSEKGFPIIAHFPLRPGSASWDDPEARQSPQATGTAHIAER